MLTLGRVRRSSCCLPSSSSSTGRHIVSLSVVERLRVLLSVVAVILFAVVDPAVRRRAVPGTSSCPVAVVVLLWVATAEAKRIL